MDGIIILILISLIAAYVFTVAHRKKKQIEVPVQREASQISSNQAPSTKIIRKAESNRILIDYSQYHLRKTEFYKYACLAGIFFFFLGYLFYGHIIVSILMAFVGLVYPRMQRNRLLEKRKAELAMQFKEAIASLSSSLAAGRSIENAFREVAIDLKLLYPDPNTYILREFGIINRRVENSESIERAVEDFARRSDVEDIANFSDVFLTCKRTGGDLVEVIRRTSDIIGEKLDIQQEISVMISQKRFESKVLTVVPLGVILMMKYSAGDYMKPLYEWPGAGPLVMTACLGILGFSFWLSQKIMKIEV
ncbi:MAG TPA: type II secretion system F family protein [Bacillales bacterium]|nr:type II secretion system F family protein [Bacillales bacterium]